MRFLLDAEQRAFADSLNALLTAADTPPVIRAWAIGDRTPGRALWSRLADAGVFALALPEAYEGVGPLPVELAVAFVELGRHGVPGPLVETVAAAVLLSELGESGPAKRLLPALASGEALATVALPGGGPFVLDAEAADIRLTVDSPKPPHGTPPRPPACTSAAAVPQDQHVPPSTPHATSPSPAPPANSSPPAPT